MIGSKLIHFPSSVGFNKLLSAGNIPSNALAFIDDTNEIWTHGKFYGAKSYLSGLGTGFLSIKNGTPSTANALKLWERWISPTDGSVGGEITIREGRYVKYDSDGNLVLQDGYVLDEQVPARINLLVSGTGVTSSGSINNIGWHLNGPNYDSAGVYDYNFSISFSDKDNNNSHYLTLTENGAMTLNGEGFNVSAYSSINGTNSFSYGILTSNSRGNIIAQQAYLQGKYINDTPSVFNSAGTNTDWNSIKQREGNTIVSIDESVAYLIAKGQSPATGWKPWIAAVNSDNSSWGIGLGESSFWIGRIAKEENNNKLTNYWQFDASGYITAKGYKVINGDSDHLLLANGTTIAIEDIQKDSSAEIFTTAIEPHQVFIGSIDDENKPPTFRTLDESDIPTLSASKISGFPTIVNTGTEGLVPAFYADTKDTSVATNSYNFLGINSDNVLKWYSLPSNAFNNTTYSLYAGVINATGNSTEDTPNLGTYLSLRSSSSTNSNIKITGTGTVSVKSNGGTITIDGTAHPTSLKSPYSLLFSSTGNGDTENLSYDGSSQKTISYNSIGAAPTSAGVGSIVTIEKTLTITNDWLDTGIEGDVLETGSHVVQLYSDNNIDGFWKEYFTGIMSWYSGTTNDTGADEILLHKAGYAPNGRHLYLRVLRHTNGKLSLQIAGDYTGGTSYKYTFKFRKLI